MHNLAQYHVRYVVLEGAKTYMGVSLTDFPRLAALTSQRRCDVVQQGPFTIIDLCHALEDVDVGDASPQPTPSANREGR
jgi:hypothetical protein